MVGTSPPMAIAGIASALRLRGDLARWRLGPRARLARWRHCRWAPGGRLADRLAHPTPARKQIGDLVSRQRLEFEQTFGQDPEIGTFFGENLSRLGISGFDEPADFSVDFARSFLGNVLLARYLVAEKNLVLVLAIGNSTERVGQAPTRHHHARELGRLLDIGGGAGRHLL